MQDKLIAKIFNACFEHGERTRLIGGAAEPLYAPATETAAACLYYREDFAASALHEAAHWCLAGVHRRTKVDFGYDYLPPPRTPSQQASFFAAEIKTQSLEQLFSESLNLEFAPSADNLDADLHAFRSSLQTQRPATLKWLHNSPDRRAHEFICALSAAHLNADIGACG